VTASRDTPHMWTQIVGKIRLTHAPMVNHWWRELLGALHLPACLAVVVALLCRPSNLVGH